MRTAHNLQNQQRGAVLIISLLILMVLTLIGVSSLDGSIMEEKMASNSQTATATFQKAESSIQEAYVVALDNPPGAVETAMENIAANTTVDHSANGITSASRLNNPTGSNITPLLNSSSEFFIARRMEIVGTANVGDISNTNVRGYRVFPLMNVN